MEGLELAPPHRSWPDHPLGQFLTPPAEGPGLQAIATTEGGDAEAGASVFEHGPPIALGREREAYALSVSPRCLCWHSPVVHSPAPVSSAELAPAFPTDAFTESGTPMGRGSMTQPIVARH